MSTTAKLLLGLILAAISATIVSVINTGSPFDPLLLIAFSVTTLAGVLLGNMGTTEVEDYEEEEEEEQVNRPRKKRAEREAPTHSGDREFGEVKWFNVSKGFGFIIRDNGEEIFVHFRSIRGKGRRGLRDGERVSYVVIENEKGPQAEDVAPES